MTDTDLGAWVGLATVEREKAACLRRRVGCVIVRDGAVVGRGHNRSRVEGRSCLDGDCPRGLVSYADLPAGSPYGNCIAIHAEEMALREAGDLANGAVAFVTCAPCAGCAKKLKEANITMVVVEEADQ